MPLLTIYTGKDTQEVTVARSANLRQSLLDAGLSPYVWLTRQMNCRGRGLCATCGVWIAEAPEPTHWHDRAARAFGYPRLSCQIVIEDDMTVSLIPEKIVWGGRGRRER